MPIETINFNGTDYPALQAKGFASKFAFPFAQEMLRGYGLDVGYSNPLWKYPGAIGVDDGKIMKDGVEIREDVSAMCLPDGTFDYIFSSHMIEHYKGRFQELIEYWVTKLNPHGTIFMYLPNCLEQDYWAWKNEKHIHVLNPELMHKYCQYLKDNGLISSFIVTPGCDLNASFYCIITANAS